MELLVIPYLLVAFVVGYVASERGRSVGGFVTLSIFTTPIIAILVLIALPAKPKKQGFLWRL
jgi:hypothetical protein